MAAQVPRASAGVDDSRPAPARIYDYMLRGDNHFQIDILAVERILSAVPEIRDCAWSNRGFHQRAAKWMAERGVRQFVDIGSGLPTVGNTHEVVQKVIPDARVVYVDNDPMVAEQGGQLLAEDRSTRVICADLREPESILDNPEVAYQVTARAWQASWKGTVRRTAPASRLRACPAPKTCFASSIATSMDHLLA